MYFDQLLCAARSVHVVYLDQPLCAALSYTLYLITIIKVCLSVQPWHLRTLTPNPQNKGSCSTGLKTGCKTVLFLVQFFMINTWKIDNEDLLIQLISCRNLSMGKNSTETFDAPNLVK